VALKRHYSTNGLLLKQTVRWLQEYHSQNMELAMAEKTSNGKIKRTSKGIRKHIRRMKQESRKAGIPVNELKKKVRAPQIPKKEA